MTRACIKSIFGCIAILAFSISFSSCVSSPARSAVPADSADEALSDGEVGEPSSALPLEADEPETALSPAAEEREEAAERGELALTLSSGPWEFNPLKSFLAQEAQIFTALYEGLFSYHPLSMEPVYAVASSFDLSEDKLTWTFHLRANARYWNGDKVTAGHFKAAWLSMIDPAALAPYSSLFDLIAGAKDYRLGRGADPDSVGIEAVDDATLQVRLAAPASFFPSVLCHHSFLPVHPKMAEVEDWNTRAPLSNGPFYLLERDDSRFVLAKNELYWDARNVSLKRIVFLLLDDNVETAAAWEAGGAQWVPGNIDLSELSNLDDVIVNAMFATHYYFFRCAEPPWTDPAVRRALSLALPWTELRAGYQLPAPTLIYPIPNYPKVSGLSVQDLEKAKALLAEAGYANGEGLPELTVRIMPAEDSAEIAQKMKTVWEGELGLKVTIDVVPFVEYYASLKRADYQIGSSTWVGDFADPYTFLQIWGADSNLNDARYNDEHYDSLIARSMTEEGEERWKTLAEAEDKLLSDGVVFPICYQPALNVIDMDELGGWFPNALDLHPFKYMYYKGYKALPGVALAR